RRSPRRRNSDQRRSRFHRPGAWRARRSQLAAARTARIGRHRLCIVAQTDRPRARTRPRAGPGRLRRLLIQQGLIAATQNCRDWSCTVGHRRTGRRAMDTKAAILALMSMWGVGACATLPAAAQDMDAAAEAEPGEDNPLLNKVWVRSDAD